MTTLFTTSCHSKLMYDGLPLYTLLELSLT